MSTGDAVAGVGDARRRRLGVVVVAGGARRAEQRERQRPTRTNDAPPAATGAARLIARPRPRAPRSRVERAGRRQTVGVAERGRPSGRGRAVDAIAAVGERVAQVVFQIATGFAPTRYRREHDVGSCHGSRVEDGGAVAYRGRRRGELRARRRLRSCATRSYAVPRVCSHVSNGSRPGVNASAGIDRSSCWNQPGNASLLCQSIGVTRSTGTSSVRDEVADGLPEGEEPDRGRLGLGVGRVAPAPGLLTAEVDHGVPARFADARPRDLAAACVAEHVGAVRARRRGRAASARPGRRRRPSSGSLPGREPLVAHDLRPTARP